MHPVPSVPSPDWEGIQDLARILRGPQGCPWDRRQSVVDLAAHLVEEAYEVLHAAEAGHPADIAEELGDTLFLISLVQAAAEEQGAPAWSEITDRAVRKLVARHPHVFEHPEQLEMDEIRRRWERRKAEEKAEKAARPDWESEGAVPPEAIASAPAALPALLSAFRVQEKAAAVGFDWARAEDVLPKIEEELIELRDAMNLTGEAHIREELGDLLFSVVNLSRMLRIDPEAALRSATEKFRARFNGMDRSAASEGHRLENLGLDAMEEYWKRIKADHRAERPSAPPDSITE